MQNFQSFKYEQIVIIIAILHKLLSLHAYLATGLTDCPTILNYSAYPRVHI